MVIKKTSNLKYIWTPNFVYSWDNKEAPNLTKSLQHQLNNPITQFFKCCEKGMLNIMQKTCVLHVFSVWYCHVVIKKMPLKTRTSVWCPIYVSSCECNKVVSAFLQFRKKWCFVFKFLIFKNYLGVLILFSLRKYYFVFRVELKPKLNDFSHIFQINGKLNFVIYDLVAFS